MAEKSEVFVKKADPDKVAIAAGILDEKETKALARAELAEQIGMQELAKADLAETDALRAIQWCEARAVMPTSAADKQVWDEWLPTSYKTDHDHWIDSEKSWSSYAYFEGIPNHIRKLIAEVKPIFSALEIRTPEKVPVPIMDPVLFGHIDHPNGDRDTVLLARWAESDANYVSFDDVKEIVTARRTFFQRWPEFDQIKFSFDFWMFGGMLCLICGLLLSIPVGISLGYLLSLSEDQSFSLIMSLGIASFFLPLTLTLSSLGQSLWKKFVFRRRRPDLASMV